MFEIGQSRTPRFEAHDPLLDPRTADLALDPAEEAGRHPLSPLRSRRARLLAAALVAGLAIGAVEEATRLSGTPELVRLARFAGFGIDQVSLEGHRMTFDGEIFDAMDLGNVRTFAALDSAAVKARIERLSWIDTAELSRVYPGRLEVRVTERTPYALWSRAGRRYLIDKSGRVLAAVSGEALPDLPRFSGEGAAGEAASLTATVARYPEIASRLSEAERVSERRWTLRLTNGTTLVLPADNEVGALEMLSHDSGLLAFVRAGGKMLDFRGPGRVAVRNEETGARDGPEAAPGAGS